METKDGRPCVLIIKLLYKGKNRTFVVPLRSNISPKAEQWEYKKLPPNKETKPGFHHGIHYIKIFPITKKYIDRYNINKDIYLCKVKKIIDRDTKQIVQSCQEYLNKYESGNKHRFSVDIDGIINVLEKGKQS